MKHKRFIDEIKISYSSIAPKRPLKSLYYRHWLRPGNICINSTPVRVVERHRGFLSKRTLSKL